MSSNGYRLEVTQAGKVFNLRASWAAPFFVVADFDATRDESPGLHHCENIEHARSIARFGGTIFNSKFEEVRS